MSGSRKQDLMLTGSGRTLPGQLQLRVVLPSSEKHRQPPQCAEHVCQPLTWPAISHDRPAAACSWECHDIHPACIRPFQCQLHLPAGNACHQHSTTTTTSYTITFAPHLFGADLRVFFRRGVHRLSRPPHGFISLPWLELGAACMAPLEIKTCMRVQEGRVRRQSRGRLRSRQLACGCSSRRARSI